MQKVDGLTYVPNFINKDEETQLIKEIIQHQWNTSLKRRTQHFGYKYVYEKNNTLQKSEPISPTFEVLKSKIEGFIHKNLEEQQEYQFDQLIINEYEPGQGISAHIDNKVLFADVIVSLSLNSNTTMVFEKENHQKQEITLQNRSLLILSGDSRLNWKHSIPARKKDKGIARGLRYSLTFRKTKQ